MVAYETQIKNLEEQIAKKEARIKELKAKKESSKYGKRMRYVLGGDVVAAGITLDPESEIKNQAFISYLKKYHRSIMRYIQDFGFDPSETSPTIYDDPDTMGRFIAEEKSDSEAIF